MKVEIRIEEEGLNSSKLLLNGSIGGWGPIQKRALRNDMRDLQQAIVHVATRGPLFGEGVLSGEPARLADLHDKGVLTEDEFRQAKARLLGT